MTASNEDYLELLAEAFPTAAEAADEIMCEAAELALPKPTELFISDVHGEYEAFANIVRGGCGAVWSTIEKEAVKAFLPCDDPEAAAKAKADALLALVCYPEQKIEAALSGTRADAWMAESIADLSFLCSALSKHQYSLTQLGQLISEDFEATITELLRIEADDNNEQCRDAICQAAISSGFAPALIVELAHLAQRLAVGKLHLVGDIYDRGPAPDKIMDELMDYHNVDVQWGNHDIVWMGAALGQRGCIAHVVRNCARYGNLDILTEGYGLDLSALYNFALSAYADDPCVSFKLKTMPEGMSEEEELLNIKVQKAMAILQFKVEAQLIDENPSFGLEDRKLLHQINRDTNTIVIDGTEYAITDTVFPTVDWSNPYALTAEEEQVMQALEQEFQNSAKLQRHMNFFLEEGSLYKIENNHLMFHACVPLNEDGSLKAANIYGTEYKGKALFDAVDQYVRDAFTEEDPAAKKRGMDLLWYLWLGEASPLFAKSKMATFEIYLIAEKPARKEVKNAFYTLYENEDVVNSIFVDFGMNPAVSRIVCGHVPVKIKDGENPLKCGGKVVDIDGGMSSAYQKSTGIAGMTLIHDCSGVRLATHQPFAGEKAAVEGNARVTSQFETLNLAKNPVSVAVTDEGTLIKGQIQELKDLIEAYSAGKIEER